MTSLIYAISIALASWWICRCDKTDDTLRLNANSLSLLSTTPQTHYTQPYHKAYRRCNFIATPRPAFIRITGISNDTLAAYYVDTRMIHLQLTLQRIMTTSDIHDDLTPTCALASIRHFEYALRPHFKPAITYTNITYFAIFLARMRRFLTNTYFRLQVTQFLKIYRRAHLPWASLHVFRFYLRLSSTRRFD